MVFGYVAADKRIFGTRPRQDPQDTLIDLGNDVADILGDHDVAVKPHKRARDSQRDMDDQSSLPSCSQGLIDFNDVIGQDLPDLGPVLCPHRVQYHSFRRYSTTSSTSGSSYHPPSPPPTKISRKNKGVGKNRIRRK